MRVSQGQRGWLGRVRAQVLRPDGRVDRRALTLGLVVAALLLMTAFAPSDGDPGAVAGALAQVDVALPPQPLATHADEASSAPGRPANAWTRVEVRPGQTLGAIFTDLGLAATTLHRLLQHPGARAPLSRIRPGDRFDFRIGAEGVLEALAFERDEATRVILHVEDGGIREETQGRALQRRVLMASGEITDSFYAAAERAGMSPPAIFELAKVFGYDIDFAQDLRVGDRFDVVYEEIWRDGERLRDGDILAATFVNQNRVFDVYRYQFADGRVDYFDAEGRPMKKGFLRMPIDFARISSRFSSARKHPVLGVTRAHRGVDYAAAPGTPIRAAGDGKVSFAGWKGGLGRAVVIQHAGNVTTVYGHMSRLGRFKAGQRVRQGEVIGFVGSSGLASGPHLHYEFQVAGVHRDPLKVTFPKPEPLPASELARFRLHTQPLSSQLALLAGGRTLATAERERRDRG